MAEKNEQMPVQKGRFTPPETMHRPLASLRNEIDRMFDEVMSWSPFRGPEAAFPLAFRHAVTEPRVDFIEKDDCFQIDLEVPGLAKDDIDISMSDDSLTVRAEVKEEEEKKGKDYFIAERRRGSFVRTFGLPSGIDTEKVEADLKDGVLTIKLPKSPEAQQKMRRIEVKSH